MVPIISGDGRRRPSYCSSNYAVVLLVAVSLVGLWIFTSSISSGEILPPAAKIDVGSVGQQRSSGGEREKSESLGSDNGRVTASSESSFDSEGGDSNMEKSRNDEKYSDSNGGMEEIIYEDGQTQDESGKVRVEEETKENEGIGSGEKLDEKNDAGSKEAGENEVFPSVAPSDLLNETNTQNGAWSTQAVESKNEKELRSSSSQGQKSDYNWKLCNVTVKADYIPCLDNVAALKRLRSTKHYEHRERHCPEDPPTCLVPLPDGYKKPIRWPDSREKIWYNNVPHTKLVDLKGHQNWVKVSGEYLTFPGGGTQFVRGAHHYIDFIQEALPEIAWGKRTRVILDVGCGVASFGGYLFDRDVLTMSFAPKDEHEAQVQFALERGIPAVLAVMGTKRLPFPSKVFDVVHCARCRVPWHIEGGMLLLELNRLLRPGGYFVWSATPIYRQNEEDVGIWKAMVILTKSMCWEMVSKKRDKLNNIAVAIYRKPYDNACYEKRTEANPPLCQESDDPDAAWNVQLQACMHKLPVGPSNRGTLWPEQWPLRLEKAPYWLNRSQVGVYGRPTPEDFEADYEHWKWVVSKSYLSGLGIDWSTVRNVMDMRSVYGGFAAALRDLQIWVMNIVSIDSPDTLPVIYERGLFGMYHDWCESFNTYPRTYDLLHADHLFSSIKKRCQLLPVIAEVDRILRPEGKLIVRDNANTVNEIENIAKSLHWEIRLIYLKDNEGLLFIQKTMWRPEEFEESKSS